MCGERDFGAFSPKWDDFIEPLPQGLGIYVEQKAERLKESAGMDDSKEGVSCRHIWNDAHLNPQRLAVYTGPAWL